MADDKSEAARRLAANMMRQQGGAGRGGPRGRGGEPSDHDDEPSAVGHEPSLDDDEPSDHDDEPRRDEADDDDGDTVRDEPRPSGRRSARARGGRKPVFTNYRTQGVPVQFHLHPDDHADFKSLAYEEQTSMAALAKKLILREVRRYRRRHATD